jgi:hypothetical protein
MASRPEQLPRFPMDTLLTRDELTRILGRRDVAKLLTGPFRADPDACPARVALGLMVLELVAEQGIDDLVAIAIAEAAMQADPQQHRYLVGGWYRGRATAAFVSGELAPRTETAAEAVLRLGVVLADRWPVPADTMAFDLIDRLARMRTLAA